jgi:transcriptional regulator with XRE-family HTH domain
MNKIKLGIKVKSLRTGEWMTQQQLSIDSGLTPTTISRIENGKGASVASLKKIVKALGTNMHEFDDIMEDTE